jgi:hypothetical protein
MRRLVLFGFSLLFLVGCGSGSNSSPSTEQQTGILIQGSVNDDRVPFAIMKWATTDESFQKNGVADNNGDWVVFVPLDNLNSDQALTVSAVNPSNQRAIRSVVPTDDLLSAPGLYSSDLTTVSHFTEAAYQLLGFGDGHDPEKMSTMKALIKLDSAGNPRSTGEPLVDHFAIAVQKMFHSPDTASDSDVAPERSPLWQVWAEENSSGADGFRADCASCHQEDFCTGCHSSGNVYTQEKFAQAVRGEHWSAFHLTHPVTDRSQLNQCASCHRNDFCFDCHTQSQAGRASGPSHARTFNMGLNGDITAIHGGMSPATNCDDCHTTGATVAGFQGWAIDHANDARWHLNSCQTCHPQGDVCLNCHSAKSGAGNFNPHGNVWPELVGGLEPSACSACH